MRKILIIAQVLIALVIVVKVASVFEVVEQLDIFKDANMIVSQAMAQPKAAPDKVTQAQALLPGLPVAKTAIEDILAEQRDLAGALASQKKELDDRENALRADEQRLIAMRNDITGKIAILKAQEEKLASQLDAVREEDIRRYKEMAKVYDATPPNKAGPMLEKLDTKTAAGITINMKKEKAGAVWAYISPQKAVEITNEITRRGGQKKE